VVAVSQLPDFVHSGFHSSPLPDQLCRQFFLVAMGPILYLGLAGYVPEIIGFVTGNIGFPLFTGNN
jgi:hypothetical protein